MDIRVAFSVGIYSLTLLTVVSLATIESVGIGGAVVGGISIGLILSLSAYLYRILIYEPTTFGIEAQKRYNGTISHGLKKIQWYYVSRLEERNAGQTHQVWIVLYRWEHEKQVQSSQPERR